MPQILKASLGTCVGVALYDKENSVGGLIHLLLDKPPTGASNFQPEKYATTGLPLFLDALLNAGASIKNLIGWVAGGALVGPLEKYDLEFNIGGRTTEQVISYLVSKHINIKKSETGGSFTCVLSLNLQSSECIIEPAGYERTASTKSISLCTDDDITHSIENLQPIPQVALKILGLINENDYDIDTLTAEMREDQTLSARTIKLCNSAHSGSRNKIETIDHALVYLGQKPLLKFVISAAIEAFFKQAGMGYSLCKGGLYHHAVGTAKIAEKIAEITGKVDPALAYTGGLLHDIGKVVLDQYLQDALPLFYRQVYEEKKVSLEAEKALLGFDHKETGSILAKQWFFPESLYEVVKYHHKPEDAVQYKELVHIIYLADLLMSRFHVGLELEQFSTGGLTERLKVLGLSVKSLPDIIDLIPTETLDCN
ncbi:MAG: HDOD domain-containing protein [Desulfotalea sp.]